MSGGGNAGIAVKKGDLFGLLINGIVAQTIRANLCVRPAHWWERALRALRQPGGADPFNIPLDVTSTTDRSQAAASVRIEVDGEVDSCCTVGVGGTGPTGPGELYIQAVLYRGGSSGTFALVAEGYGYGSHTPGYPDTGANGGPLDGPGRFYSFQAAQPGAGAQSAVQTVPTNSKQKVHVVATPNALVTGVAAANRHIEIAFTDAAGRSFDAWSGGFMVASSTIFFAAGLGTPPTDVSDFALGVTDEVSFALPDIVIAALATYRFFVARIQVADQVPAINYFVEEWITP